MTKGSVGATGALSPISGGATPKPTPAVQRKTPATEVDAKNAFYPSTNFKDNEKAPFFLCAVPLEASLFEIYFDLENNQW